MDDYCAYTEIPLFTLQIIVCMHSLQARGNYWIRPSANGILRCFGDGPARAADEPAQ